MSIIEITRFHSGPRGYTKADSCKVPARTDNRFHDIVVHIENAVAQLRLGLGEPRGLSFAAYRGSRCVNKDVNITGVHALVLDYRADRAEQLVEAADRLGYAHILISTENRARTVNTITLVIPFAAPLTVTQYARLASCIATELGVHDLLEGALSATHLTNLHATSLTAFVRGELLDGEAYIRRTARAFQGLDARKFERPAPIGTKAARAQIEPPTFTSNDGLFEWTATEADLIVMRAHHAIHGEVPDLTPYGHLIEE